MNAPPHPPPPPSSGDAPQERADLSHFKPQTDGGHEVPHKKSGNVAGALSSVAKNIGAAGSKISAKGAPALSGATKKYIIFAVIGIVILLLVAVFVVIIPGQVARSQAFAAYESGRYEEALLEFRDYLQNRPGDSEAVLYSARAASHIGDYEYAASALGRIANDSAFSNNPEFLFAYALAVATEPEAADILNSLVSQAPDHAAGRLLRGVVLARKNEFSRAREDFLRADSVIRSDRDYDGTDLWQVHRRITEQAAEMLPVFDLPSALDESAPVMRRLSDRLDVPALPGAYLNRYLPSLPSESEDISADNVVGMYYALMLLGDGQLDEALVEFSKLSSDVMHDSPAGGLRGIYDAFSGDYAAAAALFGGLPDSPSTPLILFNQANAAFAASPTEEGAQTAIKLLSRVIEAEPGMVAALHNRAMLHLLSGEDEEAGRDLDAIAEGGGTAQTPILRVFAALAADPGGDETGALLSELDGKTPGALYARTAHLTARGEYENLLSLLREAADETQDWDATNRLYVQRLKDAGFLMRARQIMVSRAPQNSPEVLYEIALLEISARAPSGGDAILDAMEKAHSDDAYTHALRALILQRDDRTEEAKDAIFTALQSAKTPYQKRKIAVSAENLLLAEAPEMLAEILDAPDLPPEESALRARLLAKESPAEAAALARISAARHPFFDVQRNAGVALALAGQKDEAIMMLQNAAEWSPVNIPLLSHLRQLLKDAGREQEAAQVELSIQNIKRQLSDEEDGEHSEVLAIDAPKDKRLVRSITRAHSKKAPPDEALKRFDALLADASPRQKAVLTFQRGTFQLAIGDYAKCEEDMRDALESGELSPEREMRAKMYYAKALTLVRKFSQATEVYLQLVEANPHIPLYRRLAGGAMSNGGEHQKAVDYLRETTLLFPADIESYFALAAAWRQTQNTSNAVAVLRKALRVAPLYVPIYTALSRAQQITDIAVAKENSVIAKNLSAR